MDVIDAYWCIFPFKMVIFTNVIARWLIVPYGTKSILEYTLKLSQYDLSNHLLFKKIMSYSMTYVSLSSVTICEISIDVPFNTSKRPSE